MAEKMYPTGNWTKIITAPSTNSATCPMMLLSPPVRKPAATMSGMNIRETINPATSARMVGLIRSRSLDAMPHACFKKDQPRANAFMYYLLFRFI